MSPGLEPGSTSPLGVKPVHGPRITPPVGGCPGDVWKGGYGLRKVQLAR